MSDLNTLAADLRSIHDQNPDLWGFFRVLVPRFADEVTLNHLPVAFPMDGVLDAATLAQLLNPEAGVEMLTSVMPDYREVVTSFSVSGDVLVLYTITTGTLAGGTDVRVPTVFAFQFADGRVVQIDLHSDPADHMQLMSALDAAGIEAAPAS